MKKNYIHLQIDDELKNILISEAKDNGLSLNAYIRMILINRGKK